MSGSYAGYWVYAGGRSLRYNSGTKSSEEYTDTGVYMLNPTLPTGSRYNYGVLPYWAGAGATDYASCSPGDSTDPTVWFFGGRQNSGFGTSIVWNWNWDRAVYQGQSPAIVHSAMTTVRVNPIAVGFKFPYTLGTGTVQLGQSFFVFGDESTQAYSAEFFITNPYVGASTSGAFNRWLPVTGGLRFSHIKGAAYPYPNGKQILLVGGSGTNVVGQSQVVGVERIPTAGLVTNLGGGYQTINFGAVALPGGGQMNVNRHSFAHGIDQFGRLWVVGGRSTANDTILSSTEIFDFNTETWSAGPALPVPNTNGQLIFNRFSGSDEVQIIGGYNDGNPNGTFSYTTRLMGAATWSILPFQFNVNRPRGHFAGQASPDEIFVVGGERLNPGSPAIWCIHPFAVEEYTVRGGSGPTFAPYAQASAFMPSFNPAGADHIDWLAPSSDQSWLPIRGLNFTRVSMSNAVGQSYNALNGVSGILTTPSGSVCAVHEDPGYKFNLWPANPYYHGFSIDTPPFFVMNGCVVSVTTSAGISNMTLDYLPPTFSGTQYPSNNPIGGSTLTWYGWWLNHAQYARFSNLGAYGNNIFFYGGVTFNGDFQTTFLTPYVTAQATDAYGNPVYLKQNTAHTVEVQYFNGSYSTWFNRNTFWTSPFLGPRAHYLDAYVYNRWVLNNQSSLAIDSGEQYWGATTWDLGGNFASYDYDAAWVSGVARNFPNNNWSVGNFWNSSLYNTYYAIDSTNSTYEFWYKAPAGTTWHPEGSYWITTYALSVAPYLYPTLLSWDHEGTHFYPVDYWNDGIHGRDSTQNNPLKIYINSNVTHPAGILGVLTYYVTVGGLSFYWEVGQRFNYAGVLYGPTQNYCITSYIPPRDGLVHHIVIERVIAGFNNPTTVSSFSIWQDGIYQGTWYPFTAGGFTGYDTDGTANVRMNYFRPDNGWVNYGTGSYPWAAPTSNAFKFGNFNAAVGQIVLQPIARNTNQINRALQQGRGIIF